MHVFLNSNLCQVGFVCYCAFSSATCQHSDTHTHTFAHAHRPCSSMVQPPLVAQQGTVKLSSVAFLYCAALSCRISLLTQSCHGLQGLKMVMQRSKKWNSKKQACHLFLNMHADIRMHLYLWACVVRCTVVCVKMFLYMIRGGKQRGTISSLCCDGITGAIMHRPLATSLVVAAFKTQLKWWRVSHWRLHNTEQRWDETDLFWLIDFVAWMKNN